MGPSKASREAGGVIYRILGVQLCVRRDCADGLGGERMSGGKWMGGLIGPLPPVSVLPSDSSPRRPVPQVFRIDSSEVIGFDARMVAAKLEQPTDSDVQILIGNMPAESRHSTMQTSIVAVPVLESSLDWNDDSSSDAEAPRSMLV